MNSYHTSPLIIAGMHRSGTSWVSSLLEKIGVNIGTKCLQADHNNKRGYFEDLDFLKLNQKILNTCLEHSEASHIDWGWSSSQIIDTKKLQAFELEANQLLDQRAHIQSIWGWKDPRNTVLLNFWQKIVPKARFILVYRYPWEVADSMQRLGAPVFLENPNFSHKIWEFYNQQLLDFYTQNKGNCILLNSNTLPFSESELARLINLKFGWKLNSAIPSSTFDSELFKNTCDPRVVYEIYKIAFPEIAALFMKLNSVADLPSSLDFENRYQLRFNHTWEKNKEKPKVTIVVPCFNQGIFLPDSLSSIESHAPSETEVIIANDGSTELETLKILKRFEDAGYHIVHQKNMGLAKTRNQMITLAKAEIILPLDADNRICANFIADGLKLFDSQPKTGIVYGNRVDFGLRNALVEVPEFNVHKIIQQNYIDACALIKKKVFAECSGYDSNIKALEDWELWINASAKGFEFAKLSINSFEYRVRPNSLVSLTKISEINNQIIEYVQKKHCKLFLSCFQQRAKELESYSISLKNELQLTATELEMNSKKLNEQLEQLELIKSELQQNANFKLLLSQIESSRSWRLTSPLRYLATIFRKYLYTTKF